MKSSRPPALATWLLRHCGSSPNTESIIGDLVEQYQQGRSWMWYWCQALLAIVISFLRELQAQKLSAARAVITGWAVKILFFLIFINNLFNGDWETHQGLFFFTAGAMWVFSGWLVSRLHHRHHEPMLFAYLTSEMIIWILAFGGALNYQHIYWAPDSLKYVFIFVLRNRTIFWTWWGGLFVAACILIGGSLFRFSARHVRAQQNQMVT